MKTLYVVLLAAIAVGVIGLVACTDAVSTDEVDPLADGEDLVYGTVYDNQNPPQPVSGAPVGVYKRDGSTPIWTFIDGENTDQSGNYDFNIDPWPAGLYGKVDCTNDELTGATYFIYPQEGPVEADIYLTD
jgi:hypothetical protein